MRREWRMKLCSCDTKGIWGVVTFGFLWWESTFILCFEGVSLYFTAEAGRISVFLRRGGGVLIEGVSA